MLIEFSVTNFLSFRERQTLSMVAASRLRKRENIFEVPVTGERIPSLLKVVVIYGPNASGKSNLLRALTTVANIASRRVEFGNFPLPIAPFKFDPQLRKEPSTFELNFLCEGTRYEFVLSATEQRIVKEQLTAFPNGREVLLYCRKSRSGSDSYDYDIGELEGGRAVWDAWMKLTPARGLFIGQAVANSSEELRQLKVPFGWLQDSLYFARPWRTLAEGSLSLVRDSPRFAKELTAFLRDVDVPMAGIQVKDDSPEDIAQNSLRNGDSGRKKARDLAVFTHLSALGEAEFRFEEESEGTQNLIDFWLPWTTRNLNYEWNRRCILAVDELNSSLHPLIVAALVKKHIAAESPSQLIFTTHDTHLMDSKLLRRDQFWIAERDANAATQLRSIHDFQGRESEDVEKRYFEGRYRGLPLVRR